jgi:flagellar hook-length control protein FliK
MQERPPSEAVRKGVSDGRGSFKAELEQQLAGRSGDSKAGKKDEGESSPKKNGEKGQKIVVLGAMNHFVEDIGPKVVAPRSRAAAAAQAGEKQGAAKGTGGKTAEDVGAGKAAEGKRSRELPVRTEGAKESKEPVKSTGQGAKDSKEQLSQPEKAVTDGKSDQGKTDRIPANVGNVIPKETVVAAKAGKDVTTDNEAGADSKLTIRKGVDSSPMGAVKPGTPVESVEAIKNDDRAKRDGADDGQHGRRKGDASLKVLQAEGVVRADSVPTAVDKDTFRIDAPQGPGASVRTPMPGVQGGFGGVKEAAASVAGQIIESIRLDGLGRGSRIDISLQPAELGGVRIRMEHLNGEITGVVAVEKAQTRYELEKELPSIVAAMQHSGVAVKRVEVVMNQQTGEGSVGRERNYNFDAPHERQPDNRSQDDSGPPRQSSDRRPDQTGEMTAEQARSMHIGKDAINVYM